MVFDGFERSRTASRAVCAKYRGVLPDALVDAWEVYGFGSLRDGYLKMVDPDDYRSLLCDGYALGHDAVPMFVTAFADILTWEKGRYIRIVKFKDGIFEGVAAGFNFFWGDLADGAFDARFFEMAAYEAAVERWGRPRFDECFGYVPLLGLGGRKSVECLRKVRIKEHIALMIQSVGMVGA